jgi:hypothetical protein
LFEAVLWIKSMGQTSNFTWLKSLNRFEDFNSRLQPRDFSQEYPTGVVQEIAQTAMEVLGLSLFPSSENEI